MQKQRDLFGGQHVLGGQSGSEHPPVPRKVGGWLRRHRHGKRRAATHPDGAGGRHGRLAVGWGSMGHVRYVEPNRDSVPHRFRFHARMSLGRPVFHQSALQSIAGGSCLVLYVEV